MRADISLYLDLNEVFQSCKGGEYERSIVKVMRFGYFEQNHIFWAISTGFRVDPTNLCEEVFANSFF